MREREKIVVVTMVTMDTVIGRKEFCGNCSVGFTVGMALVVGFTSLWWWQRELYLSRVLDHSNSTLAGIPGEERCSLHH